MEELLTQPSFPEFVDWLVRNRGGKEDRPAAWAQENAWVPFYAGCPICQLPYTVPKLEDPEEDPWALRLLDRLDRFCTLA